jgi:hypothetical protein
LKDSPQGAFSERTIYQRSAEIKFLENGIGNSTASRINKEDVIESMGLKIVLDERLQLRV